MNRLAVALSTLLFAGVASIALPAAAAQCNGEVTPPHIVHMGTHSTATAGNGTVRVQIQVNADGSHTVTRIISSTNHGDDQAAREVAESSTYRPAACSGRPMPYFYDPLFKFHGASVSSTEETGGTVAGAAGGGSITARVEGLIRSGQYDTAKSIAQSALASHPDDTHLMQLLGIAEYYAHDYDDAAATFARAGTPEHIYAGVAAQAYANAAVHLADTNPQLALTYGNSAVALDHGANSHFALGVAQLANKQYAQAIETLQNVHGVIFADSHTDLQTRYGLDQRLLQAYIGANELPAAQPTIDEMHRLEPSNPYPTQEIGVTYVLQGNDAATAKNYDQAIALYEKAAALGDPKIAGIAYDRAAIALAGEAHPDLARVKSYADKALALDANDPIANFFEGYVYAQQYATSHSANAKQQALLYLNKADTLAKAAGNQGLAAQAQQMITRLTTRAGGGMP